MRGFDPRSRIFVAILTFVSIVSVFVLLNFLGRGHMDSSRGKGNKAFQERTDAVTAGVTIEWGEIECDGYDLYYGIQPNYTETMETTSTMVSIAMLTPGQTYNFKVRGFNRECDLPSCVVRGPFSAELIYAVPAGATPSPEPTPSPDPTVTPMPTATATATPTATISPTPTPAVSPGITVDPTAINFVGIVNGPYPANQSIRVTTSNNANWTSQDSSPWFDTSPDNNGPSGAFCILKPHTNGLGVGTYTQNLTFKSLGHPNKIVVVKLKMGRAPTPTPIPTTPTPVPSPLPATPSPFPSPTPCIRPTPPCPCTNP